MMPRMNAQHSTPNAQRTRSQASAPLRLCVKIPDPKTHSRAFTLIETALAMLAIGLGLLALFGLGRVGLQSAKETENDARCVQMADAVFETLRECNARFTEEARTNSVPSWVNLWANVLNNNTRVPFPPVANMSDNASLLIHFDPHPLDSLGQPIRFSSDTLFVSPPPQSTYDPDKIRLSDWNPRYLLFWLPLDPSLVASTVNALRFTLLVYPDGNTFSSEARIFQTTLTNPGGLP